MGDITKYADYDEFKHPGLYKIVNQKTGTVLDLFESKKEAGTKLIGLYVHSL